MEFKCKRKNKQTKSFGIKCNTFFRSHTALSIYRLETMARGLAGAGMGGERDESFKMKYKQTYVYIVYVCLGQRLNITVDLNNTSTYWCICAYKYYGSFKESYDHRLIYCTDDVSGYCIWLLYGYECVYRIPCCRVGRDGTRMQTTYRRITF